MMPKTNKQYFLTCFLLLLPVMAWNALFTASLPPLFRAEVFWSGIPAFITYGEHITRTVLFGLALLMPLQLRARRQQAGLLLYCTGLVFYFLSWTVLMCWPESIWSASGIGFMAPAFTPALWLTGIGLMSGPFNFNLPLKGWVFPLVSFLFLVFHNSHALLVFLRTH